MTGTARNFGTDREPMGPKIKVLKLKKKSEPDCQLVGWWIGGVYFPVGLFVYDLVLVQLEICSLTKQLTTALCRDCIEPKSFEILWSQGGHVTNVRHFILFAMEACNKNALPGFSRMRTLEKISQPLGNYSDTQLQWPLRKLLRNTLLAAWYYSGFTEYRIITLTHFNFHLYLRMYNQVW